MDMIVECEIVRMEGSTHVIRAREIPSRNYSQNEETIGIPFRTASTAYHINDLANLLVVLNSATTLLIYLSFSEKYRETLVFILR